MSLKQEMETLARGAREASVALRTVSSGQKEKAIREIAEGLRKEAGTLLNENQRDLQAAKEAGLPKARLERLTLNPERVEAMARGLEEVATLPDPIGRVIDERTRPSGLRVSRVRIPLGVILMIFESRPNVTAEAGALCLKASNAAILRGGKEARHSNNATGQIIAASLERAGLPARAIQIVERGEHEAVTELLQFESLIDLVIPRGGEGLIRAVAEASRIPVLKHYRGNCHVYVDAAADLKMAEAITLDSKIDRPSTCNAAEKLLVHEKIAADFIPKICARLREAGVEIRGARSYFPEASEAVDADWDEEYLDMIIAVKVVKDLDEAIRHINTRGSSHTDTIVTSDEAVANRFLAEVDSASVLWNASTRLADGGVYGLGAEIGISTEKLHARGPMGAEELTSSKWVVRGQGQLRGA